MRTVFPRLLSFCLVALSYSFMYYILGLILVVVVVDFVVLLVFYLKHFACKISFFFYLPPQYLAFNNNKTIAPLLSHRRRMLSKWSRSKSRCTADVNHHQSWLDSRPSSHVHPSRRHRPRVSLRPFVCASSHGQGQGLQLVAINSGMSRDFIL